jgi:hypothetical protein
MTELIKTQENIKILKIFPSFILGKCRCGCNEDIPIKSTTRFLGKYKKGHNFEGKNNPGFNNGKSNNREYGLIRDFNHPNCNKIGYLPEHVYNFTVRDGKLFCCMLSWGRVHHKDENKKNNDLSNLEGMTWTQHGKHHNPIQDHSHKRCIYPNCKHPSVTVLDSNGSPHWYNWNGGNICLRCYQKDWAKKKRQKKKLLNKS